MANKGDGDMKQPIELKDVLMDIEINKVIKKRNHNDKVIDEVARELQRSLKEKRKADLTTIKMYMTMLEMRLK